VKNRIHKLIELIGTSSVSTENAVENAVKRAHKTVKNLEWFQVMETRGSISKGNVQQWQVTVKIGFYMED